jgi:hypothetical protein
MMADAFLVNINVGFTVDTDSPDDAEVKAMDMIYRIKDVVFDYVEVDYVEELD